MKRRKLLIVEDEMSVAKQIKWGLGEAYDISIAGDAAQARPLVASGAFAVVMLDLGLPPHPDDPREGFRLLGEIASVAPNTKVIVITGNAEQENAVRAVGLGAADFYAKPIDLKLLEFVLERSFTIHELEQANRRMQLQEATGGAFCGMLGISSSMVALFGTIRQVSGTDYPVLITGASGTGKEMAARAVHELSGRSRKPMVVINCGAIPENLLESELFGHEKGAFTGAAGRKIGRFEQADKGTLFLDEIGELPLALQVKILRFLQEGTIERLGGEKTIALDARIIAATNVDLEAAVREGDFREDLFFRLNVVPIEMPALKERPEDVLFLAQHFLQQEAKALGRGQVSFLPAAMAALQAYEWPGNVRELQNRIRRALGTIKGRNIGPADMGLGEVVGANAADNRLLTLREARDAAEVKVVRQALALSGNNISQAAQLLEVSRPTMHDLLKKHGVEG
ncbi:PEP-CTERM-box response regulator transcription factor [Desulfatitalea alkaliphila]|uniref:PEP-CTERM-box response regulator transcription factor n=1 Tax=Desulfatitalea alkaliphila TaxID=2929485 RepID=A0AA41R8L3_9BACT|nr:PEP-CTERM-box response regulator transcription factor [Desulfatitalea alkaliphila]MCJ8502991.1 PEP-CTERM-box response regulator transcription factor [Desulfatitalea alkaliphila]